MPFSSPNVRTATGARVEIGEAGPSPRRTRRASRAGPGCGPGARSGGRMPLASNLRPWPHISVAAGQAVSDTCASPPPSVSRSSTCSEASGGMKIWVSASSAITAIATPAATLAMAGSVAGALRGRRSHREPGDLGARAEEVAVGGRHIHVAAVGAAERKARHEASTGSRSARRARRRARNERCPRRRARPTGRRPRRGPSRRECRAASWRRPRRRRVPRRGRMS